MKKHRPYCLRAAVPIACCVAMAALSLATLTSAEVWRCSEGYTNRPDGKTDCRVAGASESCAADGSRYFAPNSGGSVGVVSARCSNHNSIFGRSKSWLRRTSETAHEVFGSRGGKRGNSQITPPRASKKAGGQAPAKEKTTEDIFYCLSHAEDVAQCNWLDLGHFVERSLNMASDGLN